MVRKLLIPAAVLAVLGALAFGGYYLYGILAQLTQMM